MRITKKYLKRIIREETQKLTEDHVDTELDNLKKNIEDDLDHIDDLKGDIHDDRDEERRAHEEELEHEKEKHESRRYRTKKLGYNQLCRMIREDHEDWGMGADEESRTRSGEEDYTGHEGDLSKTHGGEDYEGGDELHVHHHHHHDEQGYDDHEDERLAAEHGAEAEFEQSLKDRRDDAGFEMRHESHKRRALKRRLTQTIKETLRRRR
jgi:hypothetical protein